MMRWGLLFGSGIALANLVLQFALTPFLPWQLIGLLSVAAWLGGMVAAGVFAGRTGSLRAAAGSAVIAAAVDAVRSAAVAMAVGIPTIASAGPHVATTPGLIIAGNVVELMVIGPLAAVIGMGAARLTRPSAARNAVAGD